MKPPLVRVSEAPIDAAEARRYVDDPACGAAVVFEGVVRNRARARDVRWLAYEAYPEMAEKVLREIAETMRERWGRDGVNIAIVHRFGRIEIGEVSVAIAVSSPHRAEAFEACRYAIDAIKTQAPIWKKEVYAGGEEWIGSAAES